MKHAPGPTRRTAVWALPIAIQRVLVVSLTLLMTACPDSDGPRRATPYHPFTTRTTLEGSGNICIVTQFTSNIDSYARIASDNHQAYAHFHGYHYDAFRGRVSGERFQDPAHPERLYRDGLYWQKIAATQKMLNETQPEDRNTPLCRWVMWVDADVLFTNFERPVEHILAAWETADVNPDGDPKDVVLSRDPADTAINAGVFFVKNTPGGKAFIDAVADSYNTYKVRQLPEQEAIQDYAFNSDLRTPGRCQWNRMRDRLRDNFAVMSQRTFNSFYKPGHQGGEVYWAKCDFIAHFAALNLETRIEHMERVISELTACEN